MPKSIVSKTQTTNNNFMVETLSCGPMICREQISLSILTSDIPKTTQLYIYI